MRLGCIGIGSNAIRLLVASWKDGQLCDVRRERRGTRLFAGLIGGRLTEESIQSDRKSTRLNSSHSAKSRMPSSA